MSVYLTLAAHPKGKTMLAKSVLARLGTGDILVLTVAFRLPPSSLTRMLLACRDRYRAGGLGTAMYLRTWPNACLYAHAYRPSPHARIPCQISFCARMPMLMYAPVSTHMSVHMSARTCVCTYV